jgi:hypothetical protein
MPRFRWLLGALVLGLAGALVGAVQATASAVPARARCRATAFVANNGSGSVSTIDVKTVHHRPSLDGIDLLGAVDRLQPGCVSRRRYDPGDCHPVDATRAA